MTKIKGERGALTLAATSIKPRAVKMPESIHPNLKPEFDTLIRGFQKSGIYKPELLPTIESYFHAVHLAREAARAINEFGAFTATGEQAPAALVLGKAVRLVAAQASALGITKHARDSIAASKPSGDHEATVEASPWHQALKGASA